VAELSSDTVLNCVLHRGVWVIFLFSAVVMVVTLVHFLLGVIAERVVCEPLQSPSNNQLLALVDKMVRLDKFFKSEVEINVSSIIRCVICIFLCRKHKLLALLTLDKVWGLLQVFFPLSYSHTQTDTGLRLGILSLVCPCPVLSSSYEKGQPGGRERWLWFSRHCILHIC
jgi:hypothetical protein